MLTFGNCLNKMAAYMSAHGGGLGERRRYASAAGLTILVGLLALSSQVSAVETGRFSVLPTFLKTPDAVFDTGADPGSVLLPSQNDEASDRHRSPGIPGTATMALAAVPAPAPAGSRPAERSRLDFVLSPGDLDGAIAGNEETEAVEELDGRFFTNPLEEIEKGEEGNYAGLTPQIGKFIHYFQNRGRERFEIWLARSGKYSEMMRRILAQYGLPGDLVYLALIESGFSPQAYSVARAAGPWQFIAGTARRYKLRVDWWVDERRDYEKATHAAASYLRDLYGMFDSWPLAAAAYNAGERKIKKAVARYKTDDYAQLIRHRYLARETKDYVPKMLAALSIAKEPEQYGFGDVQYEDPLEFDRATVPGGTDLAALDRILGVAPGSLREWNPELRRFCTPPNREEYEIRLPKGIGPIAAERMEEIRSAAKVTFLSHPVRKGETLASLSSRYGTPVSVLHEINGLRGDSLNRVPRVIVPVTGLSEEDSVPGKEISPDQLRLAHMRVDEGYRKGRTVRVRKGDTLSKIARLAGVSVRSLMRANGIQEAGMIRAGSLIRIPRES